MSIPHLSIVELKYIAWKYFVSLCPTSSTAVVGSFCIVTPQKLIPFFEYSSKNLNFSFSGLQFYLPNKIISPGLIVRAVDIPDQVASTTHKPRVFHPSWCWPGWGEEFELALGICLSKFDIGYLGISFWERAPTLYKWSSWFNAKRVRFISPEISS